MFSLDAFPYAHCNCHPSFCFIVQVICKDWSNLAGKNYIILNMTENIDCVSAQLS